MAIGVGWGGTNIIYVPKADLALIQPSPEVRELDLDWFRLELKDLEDDEEGIAHPDTHRHNTEVTLSGLTYARIIEIIAPYTVEFEDGQYTINCVGANHNLSDVKVANQVSLIVNNAAGLINMPAIEYSSFDGGVTVDVVNGVVGTVYNIGTPQNPVNNVADALLIASYRGFTTFYIIEDITLDSGTDFEEMIFVGESKTKSLITIESDADVENCEFFDAEITGVLDGGSVLKNCLIKNINYVNGYIEQCVLGTGTVTLGGGEEAHFLDCWSGVVGTATPIIDMGGSGQALGMRNYNGGIHLKNKSGPDKVNIDLNSGHVILDSTVTNGEIVIRGIGKLTDNSIGATVDCNELVNSENVATAVWNDSDAEFLLKVIRNKKSLEKNSSIWELIIYDNDNSTPILNKAIKDKDGNNITDLAAGVLSQELKTSV